VSALGVVSLPGPAHQASGSTVLRVPALCGSSTPPPPSWWLRLLLVIVGYLDLTRTGVGPYEASPVLIVDPNRMLSPPVLAQFLKVEVLTRAQPSAEPPPRGGRQLIPNDIPSPNPPSSVGPTEISRTNPSLACPSRHRPTARPESPRPLRQQHQ